MNVSGVHTAGRPCVMACRSQTSWEGFPLSWKWVSGETPLDILEMSHLYWMFGNNMSEMVWVMSVKTCVDTNCVGSMDGGLVCLNLAIGNHTDRARGLTFFSTTPG